MSGGSVICCSAFDANLFWNCVEDFAPTWYYASPSMHQCILEAASDRPEALAKSQVRLVCNAAGGLLPSLANQLCTIFPSGSMKGTVLPSYGMTECMPISTPPLIYRLDKTGTSGISVGPEIAIVDNDGQTVPAGVTGRISVRGAPVFGGYLKPDGTTDTSCFTEDGRFDTGDMGNLDEDGYVFINGRSKEVINRGGELISPLEVEEAVMRASKDPDSPLFEKVAMALAFSVRHKVLQEVIGIVINKAADSMRPSLGQIQAALKTMLNQVKIPCLIVYMDGGVPTNNNKVLRIKLADRMALPEVSDAIALFDRHYEAKCPLPNTPLSEAIMCNPVAFPNIAAIRAQCQALLPPGIDAHIVESTSNGLELLLAPSHELCKVDDKSVEILLRQLNEEIDGYHVPTSVRKLSKPFPRTGNGLVDRNVLVRLLVQGTPTATLSDLGPDAVVVSLFADVLSTPASALSSTTDFFEAGRDSMKAGRLLSLLRKEFRIRLPVDTLFANSSISALAAVIAEKLGTSPSCTDTKTASIANATPLQPGCERTYSSTRSMLLMLQLTPLIIFWPMRRALTWTIFMYCLAYTQQFSTNAFIPGRLFNLVLSMAVGRLVTRSTTPFLAIIFQGLVIGRYREGLFTMWGRYHTRWWLCEKFIATAGMGVLSHFNWSRMLYLRMMGAMIGTNVTVHKGAMLGEYDLITIEDGAVLERCKIPPMAPERNTSMYLGRIFIGANASIGLASIVASGTVVPANVCIGPNSSSWDVEDADEANRDLASGKIPGAHWALTLLLGLPLQLITNFVCALPGLTCLVALVRSEPSTTTVDQVREVIIWFASPNRVGWYYAALAANALLGPFFMFAAVLAIKRAFDAACGKICRSPAASRSAMINFRMQLMRTLMPTPRLHKLTELSGTHYEATSVFMRALGAQIGSHVYWPGTGPSIQDYDLIEVGNNVVFGSRAHLITSDGRGSDFIRIKDNAMVADRVVLIPESQLGEKTVMGSGALAKRETHYPARTTWVGSKRNEAICLSKPVIEEKAAPLPSYLGHLAPPQPLRSTLSTGNSSRTTLSRHVSFDTTSFIGDERNTRPKLGNRNASTDPLVPDPAEKAPDASPGADMSPFGRAFYHKQAPHRAWTQSVIFLYSSSITVIAAIWWNIASISSDQIVARIYRDHASTSPGTLAFTNTPRPISLYFLFLTLIIAIMALQSILTLAFIIAAKWILMGRRQPGSYDWDKSSYCQRWQLFLKLETLRRKCYGGNGILGMLTGTHWIVLYFRAMGAKIGKDCALFAGGQPSLLFTEPDLLTLGDRVCVDDASLVGHINTAGRFNLNPLHVGARSVLRSASRLLSGGTCQEDTCLLEHTLVMAGDVVDAGVMMQGWPAEEFKGGRPPTLKVKPVWSAG